jgi:hypothetical protein
MASNNVTLSKMIQDNLASDSIMARYTPYSLRGAYEYKDVPYIEDESNASCRLCDQIICHTSDKGKVCRMLAEEHVHTFRHELRYFQLEQCQKLYVTSERARRMNMVATIMERVSLLKAVSFKNYMNDLALQYIYFALEDDKTNSPEEEERRRWKALTDQLALYSQYEYTEMEDDSYEEADFDDIDEDDNDDDDKDTDDDEDKDDDDEAEKEDSERERQK